MRVEHRESLIRCGREPMILERVECKLRRATKKAMLQVGNMAFLIFLCRRGQIGPTELFLFVFFLAVLSSKFLLELFNATQRVDELLLAGVERMRFG